MAKFQQLCIRCSLAQIWLLRVGSSHKGGICQFYFMMLKEVDTSARTYERFGLTTFGEHTVEQRNKWFKDVWAKSASPEGYISVV